VDPPLASFKGLQAHLLRGHQDAKSASDA